MMHGSLDERLSCSLDHFLIEKAKIIIRSLYYLFQVKWNLVQIQLSEMSHWARAGNSYFTPIQFKSSPLQKSLGCGPGAM